MTSKTEKIDSDEEFQDALSEPDARKHTETDRGIDEIVEKHSELTLEDHKKDDNAKKEDEAVEDDGTTGAAGEESLKEGDNAVLDPDDELSIEELREKEKSLSAEELEANKEKANQLKLDGNELFKSGEAQRAIEIYTEALNTCPSDCSKERAVLYGNRAAAKIQVDAKKAAIEDCSKAIALWPEYVRALLRRAKLYEQEDRPDEALSDYKRVHEIDPGQSEAREAQIRLPPIINERNEKMKNEMMSSLKDLGNMILKPFGLSTNNFQMQQDPNTGSYSINFNQGNR